MSSHPRRFVWLDLVQRGTTTKTLAARWKVSLSSVHEAPTWHGHSSQRSRNRCGSCRGRRSISCSQSTGCVPTALARTTMSRCQTVRSGVARFATGQGSIAIPHCKDFQVSNRNLTPCPDRRSPRPNPNPPHVASGGPPPPRPSGTSRRPPEPLRPVEAAATLRPSHRGKAWTAQ